MDDQQDDVVLELKDLYVGYYKDLNILQALNIKARKNKITANFRGEWSGQIHRPESCVWILKAKRGRGFTGR